MDAGGSYMCLCALVVSVQIKGKVASLNEVIGMVRIGLKSLGFLLHAFLDFHDGRRLRLILQTMNKPEWLKQNVFGSQIAICFLSLSLSLMFTFGFDGNLKSISNVDQIKETTTS